MPRLIAILMTFVLAATANAQTRTAIALNWVPEPEFGGIYQAQIDDTFKKNGLEVEIRPGGAGAPTWQRVASGQVDFAVASADEVVIARANEADVVAIFTIYQTCPQAIMTHASRNFQSLADVFKGGGTLALEIGLPYGKFLEKKYGLGGIKRVPYTGGIAAFMADENFSQQCFIFSEPILAQRAGANPKAFLIADSGYNPYTGVIITRQKFIDENPAAVAAMVNSLEEGWRKYLLDPRAANDTMGKLNKSMDAETFALGAEAQKELILMEGDQRRPLGSMRVERWQQLIDQLADLGVVETKPDADKCFLWRE